MNGEQQSGRPTVRGMAVLFAVLLAPLPGLADDCGGSANLEGLPIQRIVFVRRNIFDTEDPDTSTWLFRWTNALHIVSKEPFLRSMLLFEEGDPWSCKLAAESARILRALEYINPVYITARRHGQGVEVTVDTHDQWTMQAGASYDMVGDRKRWSMEFDERNLLGWGRRLLLRYKKDHERDTWTYAFEDPNLFGSRWKTRLLFADSSDGRREEALIARPFYALETEQAWSGQWKHWQQTDHLYSDGEQVVSGRRERRLLELWWGTRLPAKNGQVRRLRLGFHHDENLYDDWRREDDSPFPTPVSLTISGPRISFELTKDSFEVLTGFRSWSAQEDIILGPTAAAGLTYSHETFGGDITRIVFDAEWSTRRRRNGWLLLGGVWTDGRVDDGRLANLVAGCELAAAQLGHRGWQLRFFFEDSHALDRNRQLTLGADVGLRGWSPDTFDGTGRALANLQWRTLVKEEFLHIFSVGLVVFVDAGATWHPRVGFDTGGIRTDAGVGLLADLTHVGIANVIRIDVAFPDDGSGSTITLTSQALF